MDCAMIANKLIHFAKRKNDGLLILKLDFHKAFDSLDWNYMLNFMRVMSFPEIWIQWMSTCLSSAFSSILVNGSSLESFPLKIGVRQGDLISPYLFVLATEDLKKHFAKSNRDRSYYRVYSLRYDSNLHLGPCYSKIQIKTIALKGNMLSPAGRLVLLKSVLYSLPIYFMSILAMPVSVQSELEFYMRRFLWKGETNSRIFLSNVGFIISNGESISLWHNDWSGNGSLVLSFPRLFQLSNMKQATVSTLLLFLLQVGTASSASIVGEDDIIWKHGSKGFSAASASTLIRSTLFAHNSLAPMVNNRSALFDK
ncbi:uncharacterized protein LOC126672663 [Mercurialis annua]|uniref:uncharacterized protein LOC126672663 n=1 Tax=Mercurialis annua TaxID=3986 RepID=UPI0021600116|nr:uncharacterized protein LOC126672663 [Mercurialis annua]